MFSVVIISITLFLPLTSVFVGMVPASDATDFLLGRLLNSTLTILKINKPVLALIRDYGVIGEFVFFDFFGGPIDPAEPLDVTSSMYASTSSSPITFKGTGRRKFISD